MKVNGFKGEHSDIKYIELNPCKQTKPDFKAMAQKALKYLYTNPKADHNYECRFSFAPSLCPPFSPLIKVDGYLDAITEGDTESRNDVAFSMMREMLGDFESGTLPEEEVHKRLLSYLTGEGDGKVCRTHEYCNSTDSPGIYINLWTSGMLLQSECLRYRRGITDLTLARRIFEGMAEIITHDYGRAYYRYGMAFYNEEKVTDGNRGLYPNVFSGFCEYWSVSGDKRCWDLMKELAEGFVCDLMPDNLHDGNGVIRGHNHVQLHAIRGLAQFGYLSGDIRYINWVKAVYDYYEKWALDTGWLPEIRDLAEHCTHSETCLNSDMFETALWLALSGYDELWDQMERDIRNYFIPLQFTVSGKLIDLFKEIHSDKSAEEIENSLNLLKDLDGGFISAVTPNDFVFEVADDKSHFGMTEYKGKKIVIDMMGCCPPEGMRAIYYAWKYTQQKDETGLCVYLPFDSETENAIVKSSLPEKGEITVGMKIASPLKVRIPAWTDRSKVKAFLNGKEYKFYWGGAANRYVCADSLLPGDEFTVEYPLIEFYQKVTVNYYEQKPKDYTYHWVGNSVIGVEPKGKYLPLYDF